jgi:hypothetical protein
VRRIADDLLRGVRLAIYSELAGVAAAGQAVAASSGAERAPGGHYVTRRRHRCDAPSVPDGDRSLP